MFESKPISRIPIEYFEEKILPSGMKFISRQTIGFVLTDNPFKLLEECKKNGEEVNRR